MTRVFFFIIGIISIAVGTTYIISYLNLIALGYNFLEYGKFICSRPECLLCPIGIIILFLINITMKGDKK